MDAKPEQPAKVESSELVKLNNHIVNLKPVIQKAKNIVIQKIIKQISTLKKKKGTEAQLKKNERKIEKFREEIKHIKKLKFNDIAIYAFENENTFNAIIKSKQNIDTNEKALARVSCNKLIVNEINKIKSSQTEWKKVFIQYKSRVEKKRNWKEKQKFYKQIEETLSKIDTNDELNEKTNLDDAKYMKKQMKVPNISRPSDTESIRTPNISEPKDINDDTESKNPVGENDDKNQSSDIQTPLQNLPDNNSCTDSHVSTDNEDNDDDDDDDNDDDDDASNHESQSKTTSDEDNDSDSQDLPDVHLEKKTNYKPWLKTTTDSKQMVIKQINLNELSHLEEIPVDNNDLNHENTDAPTILSQKANKRKRDPFFLAENGEEIEPESDDEYISNKTSNSTGKNFNHNNSYRSTDGNKSRFMVQSSFTHSLSANKRFKDRIPEYTHKTHNYQNRSEESNRFHSKSQPTYNNKSKFNDYKSQNESKKQTIEPDHLHPSWKAKKEMEEKLKAIKFKGTKIKFDDE